MGYYCCTVAGQRSIMLRDMYSERAPNPPRRWPNTLHRSIFAMYTGFPPRQTSSFAHPRPNSQTQRAQRQKTEDEAESEDDAIEDRFTKVGGINKGTSSSRSRPLAGRDSEAGSSSSDGGFTEEEGERGDGAAGSDSDGPVSVACCSID